jgi:RNA polymerase sigma factor (sigma-70 family)
MAWMIDCLLPDEVIEADEAKSALAAALLTINPTDALVLIMRYGLGGCEKMTLNECGKQMGVSASRVRQREVRGVRHLKRLDILGMVRMEDG